MSNSNLLLQGCDNHNVSTHAKHAQKLGVQGEQTPPAAATCWELLSRSLLKFRLYNFGKNIS